MAAALALAGCGRKGALDPPPSAALAQPGQPGQPGQPDQHFDEDGRPVAPPAKGKQPFFLDWLVD
jgi:predicted small lipoprotein YifL